MRRVLGIMLALLFLFSSCTTSVGQYDDRFWKDVESVVRKSPSVLTNPRASDKQPENEKNPEYFCTLGDTGFHVEYSITDNEGWIRKKALIDFENGRFRFVTSDDDLIFYPNQIRFYRYTGTDWMELSNIVFDSEFFLEVMAEIYYGFWTLDPYVSVDVPWSTLIVERTQIENEQWDVPSVNVYEYTKYLASQTGERQSLGDSTRVWVDAQTYQCLKAERVFRGELFQAVYSYPKELSVPDPMAEP